MNCGESLMRFAEVVELDERDVCPRCGTDYGTLIEGPDPEV